jgi:hypothetical protein
MASPVAKVQSPDLLDMSSSSSSSSSDDEDEATAQVHELAMPKYSGDSYRDSMTSSSEVSNPQSFDPSMFKELETYETG